jgi:pimeloyl-ACP methyl ester carboxylesterase
MNLDIGLRDYTANINQYKINFVCKFIPYSSEVILFIHGLACSMDSFQNVFDEDYFPDKSLLLVDLIGFGKSSKHEDFSYSMEGQAKIIENLLSILPKWNLQIAAHSMGGAIALLFSNEIFSRVKSFANIEGNLISEDCGLLSRGIISVSLEEYKNVFYKNT